MGYNSGFKGLMNCILHQILFGLSKENEIGRACCMYGGEDRYICRVLVGKPWGKRLLVRHRRRWEVNTKMDLQEVGWVRMDWTDLAEDRDR